MASGQLGNMVRHLNRLLGAREFADLTDGQLLERYGTMVLGVCARVLQNTHDAEDAFQATFLVLFRRSRFLNRQGSLANWLYTVAYHAALRAKSNAARRQRHERQAGDMRREEPQAEHAWHDVQPVIDEEVSHLPTK